MDYRWPDRRNRVVMPARCHAKLSAGAVVPAKPAVYMSAMDRVHRAHVAAFVGLLFLIASVVVLKGDLVVQSMKDVWAAESAQR